MGDLSGVDVTSLLREWSRGDAGARDRLMALLYDELRRLAARALRGERSDHTLQATALVNEAYLRLVDQRQVEWGDRAHFFGVAAHVMRRVLVDSARRHRAVKRGRGAAKVSLEAVEVSAPVAQVDLLALNDALEQLEARDPREARIVELRFFAGLTVEETARHLNLSPATVKNEWAIAKAWLYRELNSRNGGGSND